MSFQRFNKRKHINFDIQTNKKFKEEKKEYGFVNNVFNWLKALVDPTENKIIITSKEDLETQSYIKNMIESNDINFLNELTSSNTLNSVKSSQVINIENNIFAINSIKIKSNLSQLVEIKNFQNLSEEKIQSSYSTIVKNMADKITSGISELQEFELKKLKKTENENSLINAVLGAPTSFVNSLDLNNREQINKKRNENISEKIHNIVNKKTIENKNLIEFKTVIEEITNIVNNMSGKDIDIEINHNQKIISIQNQIKNFNITDKIFKALNDSNDFIVDGKILNHLKTKNDIQTTQIDRNEQLAPVIETVKDGVVGLAETIVSPINKFFIAVGLFLMIIGSIVFRSMFTSTSSSNNSDNSNLQENNLEEKNPDLEKKYEEI